MSKKLITFIVILCVLLSWVFNVALGRYLTAKISTWPLLNRWKLISPQAPIVITTRETVRVSDGTDILQAADIAKSKISAIVLTDGSSASLMGAAINLTADGSFVSSQLSFPKPTGNYSVMLSDGRTAKISGLVKDPATGLIFFKVPLDGVPTSNFGDAKSLRAGEKLLFIQSSLEAYAEKVAVGNVTAQESDISGQVFQSDYPRRGFGAYAGSALIPGEAVVNTNGELVGIWNGSGVISSDVLAKAVSLFLNNNSKVLRPSFGFSYVRLKHGAAQLLGLPEGAQVTAVSGAAHQAGLLAGDIITLVDGAAVKGDVFLEEILEKYNPGDIATFTVGRGKNTLTLKLTAGELK